MDTNMYVLTQDERAIVIDPYPAPRSDEIGDRTLDFIFVTHEHYDHICGVRQWQDIYNTELWSGNSTVAGLTNPRLNMSHYGKSIFLVLNKEVSFDSIEEITDYTCMPDRVFDDGEEFTWQGNEFRVIETPGHSAGSVCLLVNDAMLFCGDTLLQYSPTGVRSKSGKRKQFLNITVPRLKALKKNIIVYPGHGDAFRLKDYDYWEETE